MPARSATRDALPDGPGGPVRPGGAGPGDGELVARVLARDDRHAFAELVRRHQSSVRTLLRRLTCGDAALADDLAQDAFLRAYRGLARWRGDARLSSWLYRIAYNVFLSHRERARRQPLPAEVEDAAAREDGDRGDAEAPDAAGERTLLQHDLERAMAALSPPERVALTLAYRDGLSHAELAAVLGCPLGTAKSHVLRGKEKLKRQLAGWADETTP